jgi:predicted alpha/beta hydrolase family esterase
MRTSDVDIIIVPGYGDSGPDHWQSRWARNLKTARRVHQHDWFHPRRVEWVDALIDEVAKSTRPAVVVAHSLGIATVLHAAPRLSELGKVAGAYLVGPADLDGHRDWPDPDDGPWPQTIAEFAPMPTARLPFPARVIASSTDPFCSIARAQELAALWGAQVSIVADSGHLNAASGHGPWPEGLLTFGLFLKSLG